MATLRFVNGTKDGFVQTIRDMPPSPRLRPHTGSAAMIPGVGQSATRVLAKRGGGLRDYQVKRAGTPRGRHADHFGPTPRRNPNATGNTGFRLGMIVGGSDFRGPNAHDALRDGRTVPTRDQVVPNASPRDERPECCKVSDAVVTHTHNGTTWHRED